MTDIGLRPPATRPGHVPDAAIYDFDAFLDPRLLNDPHERMREILREAPPLFWTPRNNGHWVATSYQIVNEVARNWERFSSEIVTREQLQAMKAMLPSDYPHIPEPRPVSLDPPYHTKYRAALAKAFAPKAIMARAEEIRAQAIALIDAVASQGHCEFISAVAEPLPVMVFLKMMGLPQDRLAEFRRLVHVVMAPPTDPMEGPARMRMVIDAISDVLLARRDDPQDDLISLLWSAQIDGEPMTMELMEDFAFLLFMAGLDTVINAIGFAIRHLANDPDLQDQLRATPSLIPEAVEEMLRRYSIVNVYRRVVHDTELGGWQLKQGEIIQFYLAGAGLDPAHWSAPETFDLNRENKAHISFGAGPHRCLGSHLARVELHALYAELLKRLPTFRLDPQALPTFRGGNILAVNTLNVRWD